LPLVLSLIISVPGNATWPQGSTGSEPVCWQRGQITWPVRSRSTSIFAPIRLPQDVQRSADRDAAAPRSLRVLLTASLPFFRSTGISRSLPGAPSRGKGTWQTELVQLFDLFSKKVS
jgi:hypothetical protein